ncbi:MAG: hypothetical protein COB46_02940 [Rhodospirillaceae bacterium]|nr:MAG: hypothetical protein COB46_02940 [Rhodospirillaceae bacterium]
MRGILYKGFRIAIGLLSLMLVMGFSADSFAADKVLKLGVLAKRGEQQAFKQWAPTADFLSQKIEGYTIELVPLGFDEITPKVAGGDVDFLLVNPSIYVEMETLYGTSRLATLKNRGPDGRALTVFGGVILVKASRNDIHSIADLKTITSFMAVKENSLGGFQAAWFELKKNGIDPYADFEALVFRSKHDAVVFAVGNGEVDAGTVRTDTLERMAAEGKINLDDFKVIGTGYGQGIESFPYKISTLLVPEWPMAKLAHTPDDVAQKVAIALLEMQATDPAAQAGNNAGWTVPLNYQPIRTLMQNLRIGPFREFGRVSLSMLFEEYWRWIVAFTISFTFMAGLLTYVAKLYRKLKNSEQSLKLEINERQKAEEKLAEHGGKLEVQIEQNLAALAYLEKIRKFHELTSLLITTLDPRDLLQKALDRVVDLSESKIGGIYLLEETEQAVYPFVFHGVSAASMSSVGLRDSLPAQVAADQTVRHIQDLPEDAAPTIDLGLSKHHPKELLVLPMLSKGKTLGIIILGTFKQYTPEDVEVLTHMSDQISIMLENALSNEELEVSRQSAEQANKARGKFLANMSHEIRTPIGAIIGLSHLMLKTKLDEKQQDYLEKIDFSSNALLGLINDILDFSKIEAGKLDMEHVDFKIGTVLKGLATLIETKAAEKGLSVEVSCADDVPTNLVGDPLRLGQALTNLVGNAIKFTDHGNVNVSVALESQNKNEACLRFEVTDSGIGLTPKQMSGLFKSFSQADASTTRKYGGSGLGLAISKKLVELMGGEIGVVSTLGKGSCFFFTATFALAAVKGEQAHLHRRDTDPKHQNLDGLRGRHILLVDDNDINQMIARELLEDKGAIVSAVNNGEDAVQALGNRTFKFDLVLMDVQMPIMDGYTATKIIRNDLGQRTLPIIALTAHAMETERTKALAAGMNDFVTKPINPDILFATILKWIGQKEPADKSVASCLPAHLPPFNLEIALERLNGKKDLLYKVLVKFNVAYGDVMPNLRKMVDNKHYSEASRLAHTLMGSAGILDAKDVCTHSSKLEIALTENKMDQIGDLLDNLETALAPAIKAAASLKM